MNVLITGGAGFIGRYVTRRCLARGDSVTVLDNFSPQIHGRRYPSQLEGEFRDFVDENRACPDRLQIVRGDVTGEEAWAAVRGDPEAIVHLAAETGTGQSMYEISRYERVNLGGTALLFDSLVKGRFPRVKKLVLASSRAVYGEGKYRCAGCGDVYPPMRSSGALRAGQFEPQCPRCQGPCSAVPTAETSPTSAASFYGLTKLVQESMVGLFSDTLGMSAFCLRFQNVYGPAQSLRNPYTGILAIFSNLARADQAINVFEDGSESRDFVYIDDVAWATCRCLDGNLTGVHTLNIGSGEAVPVSEVVAQVLRFFGSASVVNTTGQFRVGDIRHCVADISRARQVLGFVPQVRFEEGLRRFLTWASSQPLEQSHYEQSLTEMREKGMMGSAGEIQR